MRVKAIVEYELLGDDAHSYIYTVDEKYDNLRLAVYCWRVRFVKRLLKHGLVCTKIKQIDVEYVRD